MPYLIDGHNLIPHIPGIKLSDPDDEKGLLRVLGEFARGRRSRIEVFFDQAPLTMVKSQTFGPLKAHFVNAGTTADQAIKNRLSQLGRSARNWTVVSSDREILAEARSLHCPIIRSPEFARMLQDGNPPQISGDEKTDQPKVSQSDIDYWLDQFGSD